MKVLLVITKADIGGAQQFVLSQAMALKQRGIQVGVAAGSGSFLPDELKKVEIDYFFLSSLKRDTSIFGALNYAAELLKIVKEHSFSIVHFNSTNTLIAALFLRYFPPRPKTVFTMHGLSLLDKDGNSSFLLRTVFRLYFKLLLPFVNSCVFVSKKNMVDAIKQGVIKNGELIPNGYDPRHLTFLTKQKAREDLLNIYNVKVGEGLIIGSIGRLAYPKNYEFVINNFGQLKQLFPELKFIIIGDGPLKEKYQKLIKQHGFSDDIILAGSIPFAGRYLTAFDIFILPSHFEGLSISLLEAIFAKVPILAANVGGNAEILGNDERFLYESDNSRDFVNQLRNLINQPQDLTAFFQKQQNEFSGERMLEQYFKVYHKLGL